MRTNIVLDDALLDEAKKLTGIKTKKALIHEALLILIQTQKKKKLSDLEGKISFRSDYDYKKLRERK
ncbi:MAG: type II toxin-antitoxin system VapB family antitoxin [Deltaproteobacteria bacterium]|nr:type II toxin-antitoxin system VapB family antitoxin [Deltaproteobacteria bacterium]